MNNVESNHEIVRRAFENWADERESFFDLLSTAYRGRQTYIDTAVTPLVGRLSGSILPHVRKLWAVEDHVIVGWDQDTATCDGKPYYDSTLSS